MTRIVAEKIIVLANSADSKIHWRCILVAMTAKALGLTASSALLAAADELIE
jgi:hypothetical protein